MTQNKKIAIVGTSPLSMLKAFLIAKEDETVEITLFDLHDRVGGAWYSDISPKGFEIECGCHIWSHAPRSYHFIEMDLGLELAPFLTSPKFVGKRLKVPYPAKKTIDSLKFFLKAALKGKWNFSKLIAENPNVSKRLFGKKNLYPKKGSPELTNNLKSKLDALPNVQFKLGFKIKEVEINEKVVLKGDETYEFDQLMLTSVSEIEKIIYKEKVIPIKADRRDYIHLLLRSDKPFLKTASYWRFMNDAVVHRISDISYQTNNKEHLMLAGIKEDAFKNKSEAELLEYCKSFLEHNKLIQSDNRLDIVKTHVFPTYYIEGNLRDEINGLDKDKIQLFHTTDTMYGMHFLLGEK